MFWVLITTVITLVLYVLIFLRQKTWIKRGVKQLCTTPIFGDTYNQLMKKDSKAGLVKKLYNTYPNERYVGMHQLTAPTLVLRDPELIKQLTVKDFDHFTDHRNFTNSKTDPLWSKNLFALKGEEWRDMRSLLSPAFTSSKMRAMFCLINDCAKQLTTFYLNKNEDKIELEMKDMFTRYANDVIATCAFGITVDSLTEPENEFYSRGREATDFSGYIRNLKLFFGLAFPKLSKLLCIKTFSNDVINFFLSLVKNTIDLREKEHLVRPDMINLLMEARKGKLKHEDIPEIKDAGFATVEESDVGKVEKTHQRQMTDIDIAAQALVFFFAGFDTVSSAMSFFAYELVANPDIQDRLIKEVDETLATYKGDITYDSLSKMNYMDMVMSEVLRKWPPASAMDRVCNKPYTIEPVNPGERPVPIKVGEMLWLPIYGIHHYPEYFENPDIFNPERFSDENKHKIKPYTYIPFGSGPRNCIGSRFAIMEVKTAIFNILTKFRFVPTDKTVIPLRINKIAQFNIVPEDGFWMALERR